MAKNRQRSIISANSYITSGWRDGFDSSVGDFEFTQRSISRGNRPHFPNSRLEIGYERRESLKSKIATASGLEDFDYVTANCQLLIDPATENKVIFENPDAPVPWSNVLTARCFQAEKSVCPICLEAPVSPRMGPCGHIYCFICVSHYMTYENDTSCKPCAVCGAQLKSRELRRVCIFSSHVPKFGEVIQLKLMRRHKRSLFPMGLNELGQDVENKSSAANMNLRFLSRLVVARHEDVDVLVKDDIALMEAYVAERRSDEPSELSKVIAKRILRNLKKERRVMKSATAFQISETPLTQEKIRPEDCFLYYQDVSGHDIYLHSVNWRCLLEQVGVSNLPQEITGKVVEVETYTMSLTLRSRYRHLRHLPRGREFHLVEVEMKSPIIREEILLLVADTLAMRQQQRKLKKARDIELTQAKAEAEDLIKSLPADWRSSGRVSSKQVVPTYDDFVPLDVAMAEVESQSNRRDTVSAPRASTSLYLPVNTLSTIGTVCDAHVARIGSYEELKTSSSWCDVASRGHDVTAAVVNAATAITTTDISSQIWPSLETLCLSASSMNPPETSPQSASRKNKPRSKRPDKPVNVASHLMSAPQSSGGSG